MLGKSVFAEQHSFYLGVYEGAMGREDVRRYVEPAIADLLGAFLTDINLGVLRPARPGPRDLRDQRDTRRPLRNYEKSASRISARTPAAKLRQRKTGRGRIPRSTALRPRPPHEPVTVKACSERLNEFLAEDTVVVMPTRRVAVRRRRPLHSSIAARNFLGPAYYCLDGIRGAGQRGRQMANPRIAAAGAGRATAHFR